MSTLALGGDFARQLATERAALGLSLGALAKLVGVTKSHIALIEKGQRNASPKVQERLAEALRSADRRPAAPPTTLAAARALQREQVDWSADTYDVEETIAPDGSFQTVRTYRGLRVHREQTSIDLRERFVGYPWPLPVAGGGAATFPAGPVPTDARIVVEPARVHGAWRVHRLRTRDGQPWPSEGVSCVQVSSSAARAYRTSDDEQSGPVGVIATFLRQHVQRLTLRVSFPFGYRPPNWLAASWLSLDEYDPEVPNLLDRGTCSAARLRHEDSRGELVVEQPLAGYTYAIVWTPDRSWKESP